MIYEAYKLQNEDKMLRIFIDESGWYHIHKMPISRDNLYISIEEIELVLK